MSTDKRVTQNFLEMTLDDLPMADGHVDLFMLGGKALLAGPRQESQACPAQRAVISAKQQYRPKKSHTTRLFRNFETQATTVRYGFRTISIRSNFETFKYNLKSLN